MSGIEVERRRDRVIEFIGVKSVVLGEIGKRIVPDKFIVLAAVCHEYSRHRYRADVPSGSGFWSAKAGVVKDDSAAMIVRHFKRFRRFIRSP